MNITAARNRWLWQEPGPKMLLEALKLYGTVEGAGAADNPTILSWAAEIGQEKIYSHDAIPWCGLFIGVVAKRAGKELPHSPLWALAWADFGVPATVPMLGDVMTFKRDGGGHVALYVGEDLLTYHVLGGNQSDQVCVTRMTKTRFYRARRPEYKVQPPNVRKIALTSSGAISSNEA